MAKKKVVKKSAKKKKKQQRKKKNARKSTFLSSLKRILFWVLILVVFFILLVFLYDYLYPEKKTIPDGDTGQPENTEYPGEELVASSASPGYPVYFYEKGELPKVQNECVEQIISHEGYTVSFCTDHKIANWVAWELTSEKVQTTVAKRSDKFVADPKVKGCVVNTNDYTRSGYDRGHLAPAADMRWSETAMKESFYLSNICPQEPSLNRGIWKKLEDQTRLWALDFDTLWVVAGPVISDSMKRIGKNEISVPHHFYKVICTISDNNYEGVAFLFENKGSDEPLESLAIPIDSVQKVTGIDFFYRLPEDIQKRMESAVNIEKWSF